MLHDAENWPQQMYGNETGKYGDFSIPKTTYCERSYTYLNIDSFNESFLDRIQNYKVTTT